MKLSERLAAIAALAPKGMPMADIGADHAYLPIFLVATGQVPRAIAVEVRYGPYHAAREAIVRNGLGSQIELRLGDGLKPLVPGEVATVVIAGMGGATIVDVMSQSPSIVAAISRFIFQPMNAASAVRKWLVTNGWRIVAEKLVYDEERLYEIIAAEQGKSPAFEDILFDIGPVLWEEKPPLLLAHIETLIAQNARIVDEMKRSKHAMQTSKYRHLTEKLSQLEEKRVCLLSAGQ